MRVETRIEIGTPPMFVVITETEHDRQLLTLIQFQGARLELHGVVTQDLQRTSFNFSVVPSVATTYPTV